MLKSLMRYLTPLLAVGAVIFIFTRGLSNITSITAGLTLVLVILFSATFAGLWPALFASFVSALCFNFFFLPPVGTFRIEGPHNIVSFGTYIITAIVVSRLSSAVNERAQEANRRRAEVEKLYKFAKILIETPNTSEGGATIAKRIVEIFGFEYCGIHVPDRHGRWKHVSLSSNEALELPQTILIHEATVDTIVDEYGKKVRYIVLKSPHGIVGIMAIRATKISHETLDAIASLVALTLERTGMVYQVA